MLLGELRVTAVERRGGDGLVIDVESPPGPAGCPRCGQVAESRGRKTLTLIDAPMGDRLAPGGLEANIW